GVRCHLDADAAFHAHPRFRAGTRALRADLTARGIPRGPARAVAHAGWELLLDGTLVGGDAERAFRDAVGRAADAADALDPADRGCGCRRSTSTPSRRSSPPAAPRSHVSPAPSSTTSCAPSATVSDVSPVTGARWAETAPASSNLCDAMPPRARRLLRRSPVRGSRGRERRRGGPATCSPPGAGTARTPRTTPGPAGSNRGRPALVVV